MREAVEFAEQSAEPDVESLAEHVYGDPDSDAQFERMLVGAPFGEGAERAWPAAAEGPIAGFRHPGS